jgi:hypothetical protein
MVFPPPFGMVTAYRIPIPLNKEEPMYDGTIAITPIPIPGAYWTLLRLVPVLPRPVPAPRPDVLTAAAFR